MSKAPPLLIKQYLDKPAKLADECQEMHLTSIFCDANMEHAAIIYLMATETKSYIGRWNMTGSNRKWGAGLVYRWKNSSSSMVLIWLVRRQRSNVDTDAIFSCGSHLTTTRPLLLSVFPYCNTIASLEKHLPHVLDSWHSWITNSGIWIFWQRGNFEETSCLGGRPFHPVSSADAGINLVIQTNANVSPTDVATMRSWKWSRSGFNLSAPWFIGQI